MMNKNFIIIDMLNVEKQTVVFVIYLEEFALILLYGVTKLHYFGLLKRIRCYLLFRETNRIEIKNLQ